MPSVRLLMSLCAALLGHAGAIVWTQNEAGLHVRLPDAIPGEHTLTLKIGGLL